MDESFEKKLVSGYYQRIVFITGAGISTNAGIPDFRSSGGSFEKYGMEMFNYDNYMKKPGDCLKFFAEFESIGKTLKESYPHLLMKKLADKGLVEKIYTQNIDSLETTKNIDKKLVKFVHGKWPVHITQKRTMVCTGKSTKKCAGKFKYTGPIPKEWFTDAPKCNYCGSLLKPDVVFYGERVHCNISKNQVKTLKADLVIVMGTSLLVHPVAELPFLLSAPKIWIGLSDPPQMAQTSTGDYKDYKWVKVIKKDLSEYCKELLDLISKK
jgi:NAD-dependent deacetylase